MERIAKGKLKEKASNSSVISFYRMGGNYIPKLESAIIIVSQLRVHA